LFEIHINIEKNDPVIFEIIDDGTVFDINHFVEPGIDSIIHEKRKGGLGIRLVKTIMDKVEYDNRSGKNICRLVKTVNFLKP
jgi:serine/threonine-protein kinase RsbW